MAFTSISDICKAFDNLHIMWIDYGYILNTLPPHLSWHKMFKSGVHHEVKSMALCCRWLRL